MPTIKLAIAGVGNCASSLLQGIAWYGRHPEETVGLMHPRIGPYAVADIRVVVAFDIDARKVGRSVEEAVFAPPNNTVRIVESLPETGVVVQMGPILDGVAAHMADYPPDQRFVPAGEPAVDVARALRESGAQILVNYMPVGAQRATELYARACLDAGVALVNCVPCFIVSDPTWAERFRAAGLPCVGDDIKAQLGATITHRTLARLFASRGMSIAGTYQLNTGGNTDFLNMLERARLVSKKISKTQAVQSQFDAPLPPDRIHIGPSEFIPFLKDNKVCFLRLEAAGWAKVPMNLELRLSVEDSPNSAAVVADAIRLCQHARDAGQAGALLPACAWTMKHPPAQMTDPDALAAVERSIGQGDRDVPAPRRTSAQND